jgi:hypothetical protein
VGFFFAALSCDRLQKRGQRSDGLNARRRDNSDDSAFSLAQAFTPADKDDHELFFSFRPRSRGRRGPRGDHATRLNDRRLKAAKEEEWEWWFGLSSQA